MLHLQMEKIAILPSRKKFFKHFITINRYKLVGKFFRDYFIQLLDSPVKAKVCDFFFNWKIISSFFQALFCTSFFIPDIRLLWTLKRKANIKICKRSGPEGEYRKIAWHTHTKKKRGKENPCCKNQRLRTTHAVCQYNVQKGTINVTYIVQPKNCTLNNHFFPYGMFAVTSWNPSW